MFFDELSYAEKYWHVERCTRFYDRLFRSARNCRVPGTSTRYQVCTVEYEVLAALRISVRALVRTYVRTRGMHYDMPNDNDNILISIICFGEEQFTVRSPQRSVIITVL